MEINTVCVVGAGTMGRGIAQLFAERGFSVVFYARREAGIRQAMDQIKAMLERLAAKGTMTGDEADAALSRIRPTTALEDAAQAGLVVETVAEDLAVKQDIFRRLDDICPPETILTSNTSSISISAIAAAVRQPGRVCGMHFFYPPPKMPVIEIPLARQTEPSTAQTVIQTAERLGKRAIQVQESPGFVFNRLMIPMINEAAYLLMENVADRDDIDAMMCLAASYPIGPLALGDIIGLDVCLSIMEVLWHELGEDKYRPCPLLRRMVSAGELGRKSGKGFYEYG